MPWPKQRKHARCKRVEKHEKQDELVAVGPLFSCSIVVAPGVANGDTSLDMRGPFSWSTNFICGH